ncbi:MAG: BatA domain-containing protein [Planctomycetota bacterium]|nr:BatA domain-containing protein [Planctomycetota bacterium]
MSFLQPWLLVGLPLVALPIIIHLINQRRFQTVRWGAMMFLLAAHRMSRGYSRVRQWLILAARTLAIAGLIFAISRPLASGWLGLAAGGSADTTIILLDRSPSMQARSAEGGDSKLDTGRKQLAQTLQTVGSGRWILIESANRTPREIESPAALLDLPDAGPASSSADLPLMLQAAHDYIRNNRTGQTEVWLCSDLQENDWSADSGRWDTLRDAFLELPQGVRFQLLAYPQVSRTNTSVRVTNVRRVNTTDGAELLVSLHIARDANASDKITLPVQFEIEGARSSLNVEVTGPHFDLKDHRIPLERSRQRGWGRVSIPADANPADDDFFFVFDNPPPRRTIIVADDGEAERPLQLVASIAPTLDLKCTAEVLSVEALPTVTWEEIALVLWQAPLPTGKTADTLKSFVERGGQIVFLPPTNPTGDEAFGVKWKNWNTGDDPRPIESWRSDDDLLARTLGGAALPVGQLEVRQYCGLQGEVTKLATLRGGDPLVARVPTKRGGVYFLATTPAPRASSLATSGVVLYAFVQRALATGSAVLSKARQLDGGNPDGEIPTEWSRLTEAGDSISTELAHHRGAYKAEDRLLAVNRSVVEDNAKVLTNAQVAELFGDLDFTQVEDHAGNIDSLIQEIWRLFLITMLIALVLEAALCLPKVNRTPGATT